MSKHITRTLVGIILAGSGLAVPLQATAAADTRVKVLSINVCGTVCNHGDVSTVSQLIKDQAVANDAHVIGTQETCVDQAKKALTLLGSGWKLFFTPATRSDPCGSRVGDHDYYGNATFMQASSGTDFVIYPLPNPADRQGRKISCVTANGLRGRSDVRLCNTHLDYSDQGNPVQAQTLTDTMDAEKRRHQYLIMTGDVNFPYRVTDGTRVTTPLQEQNLAAVLPGEVLPAAADQESVDRIKFNHASQGAVDRSPDLRTDHKIYATNIYLAG